MIPLLGGLERPLAPLLTVDDLPQHLCVVRADAVLLDRAGTIAIHVIDQREHISRQSTLQVFDRPLKGGVAGGFFAVLSESSPKSAWSGVFLMWNSNATTL